MHFFALIALRGTLTRDDAGRFLSDPCVSHSPFHFQDHRVCLGITEQPSQHSASGRNAHPASFASRGSLHAAVLGEPRLAGEGHSEAPDLELGSQAVLPVDFDPGKTSHAGGRAAMKAIHDPDTRAAALLLHLYERYGEQAAVHTDGLFAGIVWDERRKRLWAACGRIGGFHPIYYVRSADRFALSSSVHTLLTLPGVPRALDPDALYELVATGYVLPPRTLLRDIRQMAPWETLTLEDRRESLQVVDRISPEPQAAKPSVPAAELLAGWLDRAVGRATDTSSEAGFLLSGGVDSSTLLAIASRQQSAPLQAYTGSFPGHDLDESPAETQAGSQTVAGGHDRQKEGRLHASTGRLVSGSLGTRFRS